MRLAVLRAAGFAGPRITGSGMRLLPGQCDAAASSGY